MKIITATSILICSVFLVSCGGNSPPECSDSDVKDIVFDITKTELKKNFLTRVDLILKFNSENKEKFSGKSQEYIFEKYTKYVNDLIDDFELSMKDIRTNDVNEKIKKSECEGELIVNDREVTIKYTTQYTDDGDVFVEVYGL